MAQVHFAPGHIAVLARDCYAQCDGYLNARAGEQVEVLYVGSGLEEEGWLFVKTRSMRPKQGAWVSAESLLATASESLGDRSSPRAEHEHLEDRSPRNTGTLHNGGENDSGHRVDYESPIARMGGQIADASFDFLAEHFGDDCASLQVFLELQESDANALTDAGLVHELASASVTGHDLGKDEELASQIMEEERRRWAQQQHDAAFAQQLASIPDDEWADHGDIIGKELDQAQMPEPNAMASGFQAGVCGICMEQFSFLTVIAICGHAFCHVCLHVYLKLQVQERKAPITCCAPQCGEQVSLKMISQIVGPDSAAAHGKDLELAAMKNKVFCPIPGCDAVYDLEPDVAEVQCSECHKWFCGSCKVQWHTGLSCEDFQRLPDNLRAPEDVALMEIARANHWRQCPGCETMLSKQEGDCNWMRCRCNCTFCFRCGNKYIDDVPRPDNVHGRAGCTCPLFDDVDEEIGDEADEDDGFEPDGELNELDGLDPLAEDAALGWVPEEPRGVGRNAWNRERPEGAGMFQDIPEERREVGWNARGREQPQGAGMWRWIPRNRGGLEGVRMFQDIREEPRDVGWNAWNPEQPEGARMPGLPPANPQQVGLVRHGNARMRWYQYVDLVTYKANVDAGKRAPMPKWLAMRIEAKQCQYCAKQFGSLAALSAHLRNTRQHAVYACCGRIFDCYQSLAQHSECHRGERRQ